MRRLRRMLSYRVWPLLNYGIDLVYPGVSMAFAATFLHQSFNLGVLVFFIGVYVGRLNVGEKMQREEMRALRLRVSETEGRLNTLWVTLIGEMK